MLFLHQIKHTNDVYEKGIVVKESFDAAKQGYHAYLGAYAYGHDENTDWVSAMITNDEGTVMMGETWNAPEPEPEELENIPEE